MDLVKLLESSADEVVTTSMEAMSCSHLRHYEQVGATVTRARLQSLFDLVVHCLRTRQLQPMRDYARRLAEERYSSGFDLVEVQTAFNVLEEAAWRTIMRQLAPGEIGEAIGMTSTVLGAGKDALACTYVSLAGHTRTSSLDLEALFKGTEPGTHED